MDIAFDQSSKQGIQLCLVDANLVQSALRVDCHSAWSLSELIAHDDTPLTSSTAGSAPKLFGVGEQHSNRKGD